jgi:hypothetical protein
MDTNSQWQLCFLFSIKHKTVHIQRTKYSHTLLNNRGMFWEMYHLMISWFGEHHRVYSHKPWNLALTWPPYGWTSYQASISRIGRFHPHRKFALASNFPSQSAYLEFPNILTTIIRVVRHWPKCHYAAHDYSITLLQEVWSNFSHSTLSITASLNSFQNLIHKC